MYQLSTISNDYDLLLVVMVIIYTTRKYVCSMWFTISKNNLCKLEGHFEKPRQPLVSSNRSNKKNLQRYLICVWRARLARCASRWNRTTWTWRAGLETVPSIYRLNTLPAQTTIENLININEIIIRYSVSWRKPWVMRRAPCRYYFLCLWSLLNYCYLLVLK